MKFNKEIAIILVLVSLLFSAVGISFYLYKKNQNILKSKNEMVTVYIAKKDLKKDTLITKEHLNKTQIARQYILNKPLVLKEILNKYTKEAIYKNEIFIKKKLSTKIEKSAGVKIVDFEKNSYNMAFKLFKNPNFSLKPNDIINIISVYPEDLLKYSKKQSNDFKVQYVARNVKVLGFLMDGHTSLKSIVKKKVKVVEKKKKVDKIIEVKADDLILDVDDMGLLALIDDYNKGKQLWMIKTKFKEIKEPVKKESKKEEVAKKAQKKTVKKAVKKSYPYRWYKASSSSFIHEAVIEYKDKPDLNKTQKMSFSKTGGSSCNKRDKLLLVTYRYANVRAQATTKSRLVKSLHKNYVVPYVSVAPQDSSWYKLCDGNYMHKSIVAPIDYKKVSKYLKK